MKNKKTKPKEGFNMIRKELIPALLNEMDIRDFFDFNLSPLEMKSEAIGSCVYEDENNVYVEAAVPGLKKNDIKVTYEKGIVWINGEKKDERGNVKYLVKSSEKYSYRIAIPSRIDENQKPEASCQDGILKIKFAKSKADKTKTIEIS
jgi:HSP20 family protein